MNQVVGLGVFVTVCAATFWVARVLAARLDWMQRKLTLYALAFGGTFALLAANKAMNDAVLVASFMALILSFFAVLTAPDKA